MLSSSGFPNASLLPSFCNKIPFVSYIPKNFQLLIVFKLQRDLKSRQNKVAYCAVRNLNFGFLTNSTVVILIELIILIVTFII